MEKQSRGYARNHRNDNTEYKYWGTGHEKVYKIPYGDKKKIEKLEKQKRNLKETVTGTTK